MDQPMDQSMDSIPMMDVTGGLLTSNEGDSEWLVWEDEMSEHGCDDDCDYGWGDSDDACDYGWEPAVHDTMQANRDWNNDRFQPDMDETDHQATASFADVWEEEHEPCLSTADDPDALLDDCCFQQEFGCTADTVAASKWVCKDQCLPATMGLSHTTQEQYETSTTISHHSMQHRSQKLSSPYCILQQPVTLSPIRTIQVALSTSSPKIHCTSDLLRSHIDRILSEIHHAYNDGHIPALRLISRLSSTTFNHEMGRNSMDASHTKTRLVRRYGRSVGQFDAFVAVMQTIRAQIISNTQCTKRDVFYRNVGLFGSQTRVDNIVEDLACSFRVARDSLNIVDLISDIQVGEGVTTVLIVEKEAVFFSMLQDGFGVSSPHVILVTGRGFPDMATRRLICLLGQKLTILKSPPLLSHDFQREFGIPPEATSVFSSDDDTPALSELSTYPTLSIQVLVDSDPAGFEIFCTYKFGSVSMGYTNDMLACKQARWIGVKPTSWIKDVSLVKLLPLRHSDRGKTISTVGTKAYSG
ncbi:hypothetical protein BASA60_005662 [Batrachochytrium salamandrivorans]|nr:hypothetical protein BASA60_005662 [Batrachochytrium salamandrivorans]